MKKLFLVLLLLPIIFCACQEVRYLNVESNFDWDTFVWNSLYGDGGNGKRQWKYGYEKNEKGEVFPKAPPKYKHPDYIQKHKLINGAIDCDNARSKQYTKKDAVDFIIFNNNSFIVGGMFNFDNRTWGVTKDNVYFPLNLKTSDTGRPFSDLKESLIRTIQMRCVLENRQPTINEKFCVLFYCTVNSAKFDNSYCALNHNRLQTTRFAELIFGVSKIFIICFFVLFCMALPAIIVLLIKRFTPEGSIIHKAASIVEMLIIFVGGATLVKSITKK